HPTPPPPNRFGKDTHILNPQYIEIGENFKTGNRTRIDAIEQYASQHFTPEIIIGDNVSVQNDLHLGCINKVHIGNGCLLASRIFITDHFHGEIRREELNIAPEKRKLSSKGAVIIGDNVWIGEGVVILPNVKIGNGVIIGANSVITKDIPANSVVAGIPARIIKSL
ncbi:MAG: acyltransferase, partial [Flavobacteriaceae bacterium]|nr:acyltransferase [Flavobacteriaceae bacterium]